MKRFLFLVVSILLFFPALALETGVYVIRSAINRNYVIDNNARGTQDGNNIHLWEINGTPAQLWLLVNVNGGNVAFIALTPDFDTNNLSTCHALDLRSCEIYNGNNIQLWRYNNTYAQYWFLDKNPDGTYTIRSSINHNYVVDVNGSQMFNGNNIQLWESNGTNAQKWIFERIRTK